jgi:hypothetical protein
MFLLGYYYGMTYSEYLNFPVAYKRWLIERINKEITKASEKQADIPSKAPHHNVPDVRAMTGKARQFVNPRTQRFT